MTVTSGQKCSDSLEKQDRLGYLLKMLLGSSAWNSTKCFLTWKVLATPAGRQIFRLSPSMLRTPATDGGLLGTPTAHPRTHTPRPVHPVKGGKQLANQVGGRLNPEWVEHLMGYPIGWTHIDSADLAMPSSRKSRKSSVGQS
jgi:hypothetical protein